MGQKKKKRRRRRRREEATGRKEGGEDENDNKREGRGRKGERIMITNLGDRTGEQEEGEEEE